eukprot:7702007-Prorocentrum_lima.AAC.1
MPHHTYFRGHLVFIKPALRFQGLTPPVPHNDQLPTRIPTSNPRPDSAGGPPLKRRSHMKRR